MNKKKNRVKKQAAALRYSGEGAPRVVAKGDGEIASQIEAIAQEHGIPLLQDVSLTGLLCNVPLGEEIPSNLYVAIAEILAHIYRVNENI